MQSIQKEIYDIKSKLGITTVEPKLQNTSNKDELTVIDEAKNSSSWIWTASKFFGRKLQQVQSNNLVSKTGGADYYKIPESSRGSKHYENVHNDNEIITNANEDDELVSSSQCPETSPLLLGPLYVQQKSIPDLSPNTEEFSQWYGHTLVNGGASKPDRCIARQKGMYLFEAKPI